MGGLAGVRDRRVMWAAFGILTGVEVVCFLLP
jgi:hypothetical protein